MSFRFRRININPKNLEIMIKIHEEIEKGFLSEPMFELFEHKDLLCCVQRMNWSGNFNGYVAVPKEHSLYRKSYVDKIYIKNADKLKFNGNYIGLLCADKSGMKNNMVSLDLAINVHGGITYSNSRLIGIDKKISYFNNLWWFGFDTSHAGDLKPFQYEIDIKYPRSEDKYRDFEYVKKETESLAEQLKKLSTLRKRKDK